MKCLRKLNLIHRSLVIISINLDVPQLCTAHFTKRLYSTKLCGFELPGKVFGTIEKSLQKRRGQAHSAFTWFIVITRVPNVSGPQFCQCLQTSPFQYNLCILLVAVLCTFCLQHITLFIEQNSIVKWLNNILTSLKMSVYVKLK